MEVHNFQHPMKQLLLSLSMGYMLKTLAKVAFLMQWLQAFFAMC